MNADGRGRAYVGKGLQAVTSMSDILEFVKLHVLVNQLFGPMRKKYHLSGVIDHKGADR